MKKAIPFLPDILRLISRISILFSLIFLLHGCNKHLNPILNPSYVPNLPYPPSDSPKWVDWNVLFPAGIPDAEITNHLNDLCIAVHSYIDSINNANGTHITVTCDIIHCPCDPLLYNFNATPVAGSGSTTPPPPPKGGGGSGDLVSFNNSLSIDTYIQDSDKVNKESKVSLGSLVVDTSKTLAVMDTGLDPSLFETNINGLLWVDPNSDRTLRNFQWFHNLQPLDYMNDDDIHKHGTAVTSIALKSFEKKGSPSQPKPRIMVLKVLNENSRGNTFTISCALSYAAQKHATLVNASLGYYSHGMEDSILLHYVNLCGNATPVPIPILAAAGNIPGKHVSTQLCIVPGTGNELTLTNTFHPASFSLHHQNVIAVTTLRSGDSACFYQNYSSTYVNVGVVNNINSGCCRFSVSFMPFGYEGSSFATPFVSGQIMSCLMQPGTTNTLGNCTAQWSTISTDQIPVTVGGKFIDNSVP